MLTPETQKVKPILEIQNISKKYRIQHLSGGYLSLRERMVNALKFEKPNIEDFWALNDISFSVNPGESIGIIGRNGAGKSTLLKVLSKITPPTSGNIVSRGRVASLLEVGTGFHPELTGRENIYFNGSLLGMKRFEIDSKFDEIVDFSGVEKFLDTPLKHFSSGMQLRLAFAVAAFLEPEILIIDEVLAVGDAEFQKKCLGKMEDVSKSGRTILFVSHDLAAVEKLCPRTVLLKDGTVQMIETTEVAISAYLGEKLRVGDGKTSLTKNVMVSRFEFGKQQRIISKMPLSFDIELIFTAKQPLITEFCILVYTLKGYRAAIIDLRDYVNSFEYLENKIRIRGVIEKMNFVEGEYQAGLYYAIDDVIGEIHDIVALTILDNRSANARKYAPQYRGTVELDFKVGGAHD